MNPSRPQRKYIDFAPRRPQTGSGVRKSTSAVRQRPAPKRAVSGLSAPQTVTTHTHYDTPTHHVHQRTVQTTAKTPNSVSFQSRTVTAAVPHNFMPPATPDTEDDTPLMSDAELADALADFADMPAEETPEQPKESMEDFIDDDQGTFEAELEALDELTDVLSSDDDELDQLAAEADEVRKKPAHEEYEEREEREVRAKSAKADAPDNNRYSLGGRSPFLENVTLDKRPLSGDFSEQAVSSAVEEGRPKKNSYLHRKLADSTPVKPEAPKKEKKAPTIVIPTPDHASNLGLIIAIILTVILGSAVGAVAYLAFFQ